MRAELKSPFQFLRWTLGFLLVTVAGALFFAFIGLIYAAEKVAGRRFEDVLPG